MPEKDYWERKFEKQEDDPEVQELLETLGDAAIPDSVVDALAKKIKEHRKRKG